MTSGERLRRFRNNSGLRLTDAAEKAGISKQTLYKYEHDIVKNIPIATAESLARVYGISPKEIFGWL